MGETLWEGPRPSVGAKGEAHTLKILATESGLAGTGTWFTLWKSSHRVGIHEMSLRTLHFPLARFVAWPNLASKMESCGKSSQQIATWRI